MAERTLITPNGHYDKSNLAVTNEFIRLSAKIEKERLKEERLKEYSKDIKPVSQELDIYTRPQNETYSEKSKIINVERVSKPHDEKKTSYALTAVDLTRNAPKRKR